MDKKDNIILAFESSCDETSVAVVKNGNEILSNIVATQVASHQRFGGVVPEVASRHHIEQITYCIQDALDEANVDRFGKYLDHYKEKTQFLLITHKKKTMEYANTLYGITMQESGVSKLVSVKLDEHEKNP